MLDYADPAEWRYMRSARLVPLQTYYHMRIMGENLEVIS
jgi:hypothetical protein